MKKWKKQRIIIGWNEYCSPLSKYKDKSKLEFIGNVDILNIEYKNADQYIKTGIFMEDSVLATYSRKNVSFKKGDGIWLYSDDGDKFLDCTSGIAVNVLGHCNEKLVNDFASAWANISQLPEHIIFFLAVILSSNVIPFPSKPSDMTASNS